MFFWRWTVFFFLSSFLSVYSLTEDEVQAFSTLRFPGLLETNTGIVAEHSITDNDDGTLTYRGNSIPNHKTSIFPLENGDPFTLAAKNVSLKFDKDPLLRDDGHELMCLPLGPIGFAVTGDFIFGWFAAEKECPSAFELEQAGICEGHPAPTSDYHLHHYSSCVTMPICGQPSGIYGVAIDGIPIYGPWGEDGVQLTKQDLDKCSGKFGSDGRYRYHVTVDPPYFMNCLKGYIRSDQDEMSVVRGDAFSCKCPYDDSSFGNRPPPPQGDMGGPPPGPLPLMGDPAYVTCDFEADGDYAVCADKFNYSAVMDVRWDNVRTLTKLAPCCPPGEDCGDSCMGWDADGERVLLSPCTQEEKKIKLRTRIWRSEEDIEAERRAKGWYGWNCDSDSHSEYEDWSGSSSVGLAGCLLLMTLYISQFYRF